MRVPLSGDEFKKFNNHLSTLKVAQQAIPNMTVKVSAGGFWFDTETFVDFPGGSSKVIAAPTTGSKFVVVGLSRVGNIELIEGTASSYPQVPKLQYGILPLAILLVRASTKIITEELIFDVRQVFQAPNFMGDHNEMKGREVENAHPISAITGLEDALEDRVSMITLTSILAEKADINSTPSNEFILNNDESQVPVDWCGITIERGTEENVSLKWDEVEDKWLIDQDLAIEGVENGLIFQSSENGLFKLKINQDGALTITNLATGVETTVAGSAGGAGNGQIKINDTDTAGYLADKIDTDFLVYDAAEKKITLNTQYIYRIVLNAEDTTPDYIENKLDANTLVVDSATSKLKVKDGVFTTQQDFTKHTTDFNHANIGKIFVNDTDTTADFIINKVDSNYFGLDGTNKITIKPAKFAEQITNHETTHNHSNIGKVFINALDTTADFIGNKLDTNSFELKTIDGSNKIAIRADQFESFNAVSNHETTHNHNNIGKVFMNAGDTTADYLFTKFDSNYFENLGGKIVIKNGQYAPADAITTHETTYNHANIGKVLLNVGDTTPDFLNNKFLTNNFSVANGKIQLNPTQFDSNSLEYNSTTHTIKAKHVISNDFEITNSTAGVILTSPNGKRFRLTVGDDGILTTTELV